MESGFDKDLPFDPSSSANKEWAGKMINQYQYLFGLRANCNTHWTEIAQRIKPDDSYLFQNYSQITQMGDKRMTQVYDSTGILALQRFGAILDSLLTPRDQFWHQLRANDPILQKNKSVRMYFDQVNRVLFDQRYAQKSNFASQNQEQYLSLGAYGTGALLIDDLAGSKGLRYRNVHLGQVYLQENHQGIIDHVIRMFTMTARQARQKFGEKCPDYIVDRAKDQPEAKLFFLHWVGPNEDMDPERKDWKGMEFGSHYINLESQEICAYGGYRKFPYAMSRYRQAPFEAYGRSPAMDVLPAIKTLNEEKKTMLKVGHRALDPVLLAHDDGIIDAFSLDPGSINPGGITKDGRLLVQPLPVGNIPDGEHLMEDERKLINDTFLVNLFQILTETPEMTATEVMERTREKGILLAPTIGRQQSEYLGPMIDRELDILSRQGLLPPQPPLLKSAKGDYKIVYDSPISRTQKSEWAAGALRTVESLMNVAQVTQNPSLLDYINWDVAAPQIAEIYGTPVSWLNDAQGIAKIRQSRQQQMDTQNAIQAAPAAAAVMKAKAGQGQ